MKTRPDGEIPQKKACYINFLVHRLIYNFLLTPQLNQ